MRSFGPSDENDRAENAEHSDANQKRYTDNKSDGCQSGPP